MLNSVSADEKLQRFYGEIHHPPTIQSLVEMILRFICRMLNERPGTFNYMNVVIWKADLRKAFILLDFGAQFCHLLASELTDDLSMIYYTGMTGCTGLPFGFQVVTRVALKETNKRINELGRKNSMLNSAPTKMLVIVNESDARIKRIVQLIERLYPWRSVDLSYVHKLVVNAYRANDNEFGIL